MTVITFLSLCHRMRKFKSGFAVEQQMLHKVLCHDIHQIHGCLLELLTTVYNTHTTLQYSISGNLWDINWVCNTNVHIILLSNVQLNNNNLGIVYLGDVYSINSAFFLANLTASWNAWNCITWAPWSIFIQAHHTQRKNALQSFNIIFWDSSTHGCFLS